MRYHWLFAVSLLTVALPADFAKPLVPWDDIRVKHTWNAVPANWESLGHPPAGTTIDLYIALNPHQESALIDALYEVAELVRPHPDTLELISSWLVHHGVRSSSISMTHGGAWLTVTDVLVSQANQLLGASYRLYRHAKTNDTIIRTVGYALPEVLHIHIQTVAPTTYFAPTGVLRQKLRKRSSGEAAASAASKKPATMLSSRVDEVKPSDLRWLYKTFAYVPAVTDRNSLGIVGLDSQYPSQTDLTMFMRKFRTDGEDARFTVQRVNGGGNDPSDPGVVASVDVQFASAMAYPTPLIFYSTGGADQWSLRNEPIPGDVYLELFKYLLRGQRVPQTISISYGLGARGITVLTASGNDGVGAETCINNSGNRRFIPEFPSSCPFVTTVGGTTGNPEAAAAISGGGFSFHFARPPYQNTVVSKFLKNLGSQYSGFYNPEGRGIPDIAAQALNFEIILDSDVLPVGGTSCSTSTVAGIISLLNDYRISNGKPALGFLNPSLYGFGKVGVTDIKSGSNPGCGTDGFSAADGWDPVTGLGTLDFEELLKVF
ncbi:peptidase S8/S53 domain-containing protein [Lactarius psammicola]|nr:peptidase S8/S53 domain-containing protein [Lactarius psammicola]